MVGVTLLLILFVFALLLLSLLYHSLKVRSYLLSYYKLRGTHNFTIADHKSAPLISREEHEASIKLFLDTTKLTTEEGIFGPDSITWKIQREAFNFLVGGRATLLQLAHPYIALGINNNSTVRCSVAQRFYKTFEYMFKITYGDQKQALQASRFVRSIHERVHGPFPEAVGPFNKGDTYDATHEGSLRWVSSTLLESTMFMYEMLFYPVSDDDKARYLKESLSIDLLFGLQTPNPYTTWESFLDYNASMWNSEITTVGKDAKNIAKFLLTPKQHLDMAVKHMEISTLIMLPPEIQQKYDVKISNVQFLIFYTAFGMYRMVARVLPNSLRWLTRYWAALIRLKKVSKLPFIAKKANEFTMYMIKYVFAIAPPEWLVGFRQNARTLAHKFKAKNQ